MRIGSVSDSISLSTPEAGSGFRMATLLVRRLDDDLVDRLKRRAASHGRSVEAEHRAILEEALAPRGMSGREFLEIMSRAPRVELELPEDEEIEPAAFD